MKSVAEVIGVSRSNLVERMRERAKKRIGRPPLPHDKLVAEIKAVIAELPTYGYRRVHAILKRQALAAGLKPPNHKRVYRVMKVHGLLLDRHAGGVERRHDGRIAVDERNRRRPHMRTSFHHQPEAQHPNFQLSTSWQADYPIFRGQTGNHCSELYRF